MKFHYKKLRQSHISTMQLLVSGFLGIILAGAVLLWLPVSNQQPIAFIDAFFTSVSAVCVTGLVTIVPGAQFTLFGKVILLILIQVGGLGIIVCMTVFFMLLGKRITLRQRIYIQQTYNMDTLSGMVRLIRWVLKVTLVVEAMGAIGYAIRFVPLYGIGKGIWYSIFHSISAFCNAGIDILGDSSLAGYVTDPVINLVTMALIISGGLGFTVWSDILHVLKIRETYQRTPGRIFRQMSLQTKMTLVITGILIAAGGIGIFCLEYSNADTIGAMSNGDKLLASFFHAVSTRTAGFATVAQGGFRDATILFSCILMFIGGSPGGTAGGIKTTTAGMLLFSCVAVLRGGKDTECFGRKIAAENVRTGASIVMVAVLALLGGTILVAAAEPAMALGDVIYETTSAIGTVGLSTGITPMLSDFSKCVIMFLMYIGRLGPVTVVLAFVSRQDIGKKARKLPERRIMVG